MLKHQPAHAALPGSWCLSLTWSEQWLQKSAQKLVPASQGKAGPHPVAGLPLYGGNMYQILPGNSPVGICQSTAACAKCQGFPFTAQGHAGLSAQGLVTRLPLRPPEAHRTCQNVTATCSGMVQHSSGVSLIP